MVWSQCPATFEEEKIANYTAKRRALVASGNIAQDISDGHYTADTLQTEMIEWWVNHQIVAHATAISIFRDLMTSAKAIVPKSNFLSIALGWIGAIAGVCTGEGEKVIAKAVTVMSQGLTTWQTYVSNTPDDADFLAAAMRFESILPDSQVTSLSIVSDFITEIRNLSPEDYQKGLLAAYNHVTKVIDSTTSKRKAFNQYYMSFVDGANLGDNAFYYNWDHDVESETTIMWRATPSGLDACTIANCVSDINEGCVTSSTPGLEQMERKVQIIVDISVGYSLQYDCSNIDDVDAYTGCWVLDNYRNISDHKDLCDNIRQRADDWLPDEWPVFVVSQFSFCPAGILTGDKYKACNYNTRKSQGPTCYYNSVCKPDHTARCLSSGAEVREEPDFASIARI